MSIGPSGLYSYNSNLRTSLFRFNVLNIDTYKGVSGNKGVSGPNDDMYKSLFDNYIFNLNDHINTLNSFTNITNNDGFANTILKSYYNNYYLYIDETNTNTLVIENKYKNIKKYAIFNSIRTITTNTYNKIYYTLAINDKGELFIGDKNTTETYYQLRGITGTIKSPLDDGEFIIPKLYLGILQDNGIFGVFYVTVKPKIGSMVIRKYYDLSSKVIDYIEPSGQASDNIISNQFSPPLYRFTNSYDSFSEIYLRCLDLKYRPVSYLTTDSNSILTNTIQEYPTGFLNVDLSNYDTYYENDGTFIQSSTYKSFMVNLNLFPDNLQDCGKTGYTGNTGNNSFGPICRPDGLKPDNISIEFFIPKNGFIEVAHIVDDEYAEILKYDANFDLQNISKDPVLLQNYPKRYVFPIDREDSIITNLEIYTFIVEKKFCNYASLCPISTYGKTGNTGKTGNYSIACYGEDINVAAQIAESIDHYDLFFDNTRKITELSIDYSNSFFIKNYIMGIDSEYKLYYTPTIYCENYWLTNLSSNNYKFKCIMQSTSTTGYTIFYALSTDGVIFKALASPHQLDNIESIWKTTGITLVNTVSIGEITINNRIYYYYINSTGDLFINKTVSSFGNTWKQITCTNKKDNSVLKLKIIYKNINYSSNVISYIAINKDNNKLYICDDFLLQVKNHTSGLAIYNTITTIWTPITNKWGIEEASIADSNMSILQICSHALSWYCIASDTSGNKHWYSSDRINSKDDYCLWLLLYDSKAKEEYKENVNYEFINNFTIKNTSNSYSFSDRTAQSLIKLSGNFKGNNDNEYAVYIIYNIYKTTKSETTLGAGGVVDTLNIINFMFVNYIKEPDISDIFTLIPYESGEEAKINNKLYPSFDELYNKIPSRINKSSVYVLISSNRQTSNIKFCYLKK